MLRLIVGHGRRRKAEDWSSLESWKDWVIRATHDAEARCAKLGIEDWVEQARRRKWTWAGQVANFEPSRLAYAAAAWRPEYEHDDARKSGRPQMRWSDSLSKFRPSRGISEDWLTGGNNLAEWSNLESYYVQFAQ